MKRKIVSILALFLCLMGILLVINSNIGLSAFTTLDYEFEENECGRKSTALNETIFNLRSNGLITEEFNASYSFINETGDTSSSISLIDVDSSGASCTATVVGSVDKHDTILELDDGNGGAFVEVKDDIDSVGTYGTVEFFVRIDVFHVTPLLVYLENGGTSVCMIRYTDDGGNDLEVRDGASWVDIIDNGVNVDQWYHIRIDFECTAGGYSGLSQYDYYVYVDGVRYGAYDFNSNQAQIDDLKLLTGNVAVAKSYIDALGYSWFSNYTVDDNQYPIITPVNSNVLSRDMYKFQIDDNNEPVQPDTSVNPSFWTITEDANSYVYTASSQNFNSLEDGNIGVAFIGNSVGGAGYTALSNSSLNLHGDDINITWGVIYPSTQSQLNSWFRVMVKSLDGTVLTYVRIDTTTADKSTLQYYDGATYQDLETLYGTTSKQYIFSFNLYIENYTATLTYFRDYVYNNTYTFDLAETEAGLGELEFRADNSGTSNWAIHLTEIGIYQHNVSQCWERGFITYRMNDSWDFDTHTYITASTNPSEYVELWSTPAFYMTYSATENIQVASLWNGSYWHNVYGETCGNQNDMLTFLPNGTITTSDLEFRVYGIKMVEGSNEYVPTYDYTNVNQNNSYFYVNGERMYFILDITQDNTLESIEADFNIDPVLTANRSFQYTGYYNGYGNSTILLNYSDDSGSYYFFDPYVHGVNQVLPKEKVVRNIVITITDSEINEYTGFDNVGYIYNLKLRTVGGWEQTITTSALLTTLLPLIIILPPCFMVSKSLGDNRYILPIFIIMCTVVFATGLIDAWLYFIVIVGVSGFLFKRNRGVL